MLIELDLAMNDLVKKARKFSSKLEPWWTVVITPIWQEYLFRYLPYSLLYLPTGAFWEIGLTISAFFALIHWYFGKWFVIYAFVGGFVLWWVMVDFGLLPAILVHAFVNIVDLRFGIRKFLAKQKKIVKD